MRFASDPNVAERQMAALITYLTAFGYIDGDFDAREKQFVQSYVEKLVADRVAEVKDKLDATVRKELTRKYTAHFLEMFEEIDTQVRALFTEAVAKGEDVKGFVYAKLELRCFEIFKSFDEDGQRALFEATHDLIAADGSVHPSEEKFRAELASLLNEEIPLDVQDLQTMVPAQADVKPSGRAPAPRIEDHPFFARIERHYSKDKDLLASQAAADLQLMEAMMAKLAEARRAGFGKLKGHHDVADFSGGEQFLDGNVFVHPAPREAELIVLGDLHGCYSCLKAALLQADFFGKLEAYRLDPNHNPLVKLVLLGDYIDRGQFSYNGVLRTAIQLYLHAPEHVYVLRGNHEYYLEYEGKIYGGVRPAEAIHTLQPFAPQEMFEAFMRFFESLPHALLFDRVLFAHAGIPRDTTLAEKWQDLSSLNDKDVRFQMLWSDPSEADFIPPALQEANARFPFGRLQFRSFMGRLGTNIMVRGHEKIDEGFRQSIDDGVVLLCTLFSAGGATNDDLPPHSSYRNVTPKALTVRHSGGKVSLEPWVIDYERYNDPRRNQFYRHPPEIQFRAD